MKVLTTTVARYLFAIPFIVFGLLHMMNGSAMAGMVPIPGGVFWVYLVGLALILAGVSIIMQKMMKLSALLLAVLLLIFILTMHIPGVIGGTGAAMQMSMMSLLKDMALMGAALTYSGLAEN